jgi:hypothetical protein
MHKPFIYLVVGYFLTYLHVNRTYFLQNWVAKMKPNINSINVHSKLNHNVHPMDGALAMLIHCCKMGNLLVPGFCKFHKINNFL